MRKALDAGLELGSGSMKGGLADKKATALLAYHDGHILRPDFVNRKQAVAFSREFIAPTFKDYVLASPRKLLGTLRLAQLEKLPHEIGHFYWHKLITEPQRDMWESLYHSGYADNSRELTEHYGPNEILEESFCSHVHSFFEPESTSLFGGVANVSVREFILNMLFGTRFPDLEYEYAYTHHSESARGLASTI